MNGLAQWFGWDSFAWPWALALLVLPWLVRWLLPVVGDKKAAALRVPYGERLVEIAEVGGQGWSLRGSSYRLWLWMVVWLLLCVALMRPQVLGEPVFPPYEGRQMLLAVDLSGSMDEPDMQLGGRMVSRLTAVKAVLAEFLDRRKGDSVGLLVFGNQAYMLAPLTRDLQTVRQQLGDMQTGLIGTQTAMGDGIALAVKRLREQPLGERVLVLLSDGDDNASLIDPLKAAELAKTEGIRIHTIAFGGETNQLFMGVIPMGSSGGISEAGEAALKEISRVTGGQYFQAGDTQGLMRIYQALDMLEPVERESLVAVRPQVECYWQPLLLAWGFMLVLACGLRRRG